MILFYLNHKSKQQSRFIRELYRSYTGPKMLQSTSRFEYNEKLNQNADLIVFAGILRGDGLIYRYCIENNKKFLYLDHAYLDRGYNPSDPDREWMRVTPNAFNWSQNIVESNDRWNMYFSKKYALSPWNKHGGKKILVLPPSEATKSLFPQSVDWMKKTLDEISKVTSAEIYIREKPKQPRVSDKNEVLGYVEYKHEKTAEDDMLDAKCIVTFNSGVPVMGTILGIPCYCSPFAAAYPMSINLNDIDNPEEPKRQQWLDQLVYHQYRTSEIINGTFWNIMKRYHSA